MPDNRRNQENGRNRRTDKQYNISNNKNLDEDKELEKAQKETGKSVEAIMKEEENKKRNSILDKTMKLNGKLEVLKNKLESGNLTPFQRYKLENKLSIIDTRLQKQLYKLKVQELEDKYAKNEDERYAKYQEQLKQKSAELNELFDKIEEQERTIEQKTSRSKSRNEQFSGINQLLQEQANRDLREAYQFKAPAELDESTKENMAILKELQSQKELKFKDIEEFIHDYDEMSDDLFIENEKRIKQYKPSLWKNMKSAFIRMGRNFKNWRENSKAEKQAIKEAKTNAVKEVREQQAEDSMTNIEREEEKFKKRYNVDITAKKELEFIDITSDTKQNDKNRNGETR